MKKRVLMCNESSLLSTGYAVYGYELLSRLHKTGKYELAELATYGTEKDGGKENLPWKYYPVIPSDKNKMNEYQSKGSNQFGDFIFDQVCLEFKPNIVIDIRDFWMFSYQELSPARPYFDWLLMPPVDSIPQSPHWLQTFSNAEGCLTYTDWAAEVLKNQSNNKIKILGSPSSGINFENFEYSDKEKIREKIGVPLDINIVGTVMRNQQRKLYPDLMKDFNEFLQICPDKMKNNTYLYIHCAYPDVGWNIPALINEFGISHRTIFTYYCLNCRQIYPSKFVNGKTFCKFCGKKEAIMPDTKNGIPSTILNQILSVMDVYVQYANCLLDGEEVLTKTGWKAIETIELGEQVFTHKGNWKSVIGKGSRISDHYYDITVKNDIEHLKVTGEHPVLAIAAKNNKSSNSMREYVGTILRVNGKNMPKPKFVKVEDLIKGDMLAIKIDDTVVDKDKIDLSMFIDNRDIFDESTVSIKNGNSYPRYITVNNDFCRFAGLFIAEGYADSSNKTNKNYVQLTMHEKEINLNTWNEIKDFIIRKYEDRKGIDFIYCCKPLAALFSGFYNKNREKVLPEFFLYLPKEKQKYLLQGMFLGDGCYVKEKDYTSYCTTSKELAEQIKFILRRLRIVFSMIKMNRVGNRKPQYTFEIYSDVKNMIFTPTRKRTSSIYLDDIHYMTIKNIEKFEISCKVNNIEVEDDNSYLSKIVHTHNCEGLGLPQLEAAASGTPIMSVDYSAMSEVVRKLDGYPIKVSKMFKDIGTDSWRALPDSEDFIKKLINFFNLPKEIRINKGLTARNLVEKHYNWDKVSQVWENAIDSLGTIDKWAFPAKIEEATSEIPQNLSNLEFVNWCFGKILGRSDLENNHIVLELTKNLNNGFIPEGLTKVPIDRNFVLKYISALCEAKKNFEKRKSDYGQRKRERSKKVC